MRPAAAPQRNTPREDAAVVVQPTLDLEPAAPQEIAVPEPIAEEEKPAARSRPPRERSKETRHDRNRDVRGPQDRARKTRRNPHGIAEMDIDDDVVAFGGFTPAFILVDPYGGKGAPQEIANVPEDSDDEDDQSHETVTSTPPETDLDLAPADGDITELAARGS